MISFEHKTLNTKKEVPTINSKKTRGQHHITLTMKRTDNLIKLTTMKWLPEMVR